VFVEDPFLKIHGLSPALNYGKRSAIFETSALTNVHVGQQVFEGLKGLNAKPFS
jgi:hypothetical protein